MEAEIVVERVQQVKLSTVQAYADDLRNLLSEAEATERKVFLKSFVKRVVVSEKEVTVDYKLPLPTGCTSGEREVLPIVTCGGEGGIRTRTPEGT